MFLYDNHKFVFLSLKTEFRIFDCFLNSLFLQPNLIRALHFKVHFAGSTSCYVFVDSSLHTLTKAKMNSLINVIGNRDEERLDAHIVHGFYFTILRHAWNVFSYFSVLSMHEQCAQHTAQHYSIMFLSVSSKLPYANA